MPGLTLSYNLIGAPTQIYTAATTTAFTAVNSVQVFNSGPSPVYIGQNAVSTSTGMQLNPGAHFRVINMYSSLYACAGAVATATNTALAGAATAGTTKWTVSSVTGFTPGLSFLAGNVATGQEVLVVASTAAGVITSATPAQFSHISGETVATATVTNGQVQVIPGVV
jgi:hypothetical protein